MSELVVPMIDVAPLSGDDSDAKMRVAKQIAAACRGSGFFYATNHGIALETLQAITSGFHRSLSDKDKEQLAIHAYNPESSRRRSGYYMAVAGRKANESFCYLNPTFDARHPMIVRGVPLHEVNVWPDEAINGQWREYYESYYWNVFEVTSVLLRGFALALGKPEQFFAPYFRPDSTLSAVSLIRYPYLDDYPPVKVGEDGVELSFEAHQDVSLITVLYQTPIPNLQALTDTGYADVPTSGSALLVNCGTYMAYITGDYFPAPKHRVAFVNAERLSIPFFANLAYDSAIPPFIPHQPDAAPPGGSLEYGTYLQNGLDDLIRSNGQT